MNKFAKTQLVTLVEFKTEVDTWVSKGVDNPVSVTFEDGDMVLSVPDYVMPDDMVYFVSVPFNDKAILCMGDTELDWI